MGSKRRLTRAEPEELKKHEQVKQEEEKAKRAELAMVKKVGPLKASKTVAPKVKYVQKAILEQVLMEPQDIYFASLDWGDIANPAGVKQTQV
jgi:hypothetical protein